MKIKVLTIIVALLTIAHIALTYIPAKDVCSVCNEEKSGFDYMVPNLVGHINNSENTRSLQFYCNDCYEQTNDTFKEMMERQHHENIRTAIFYAIDIVLFLLFCDLFDEYIKLKKENKDLKNENKYLKSLIPNKD